MACTHVYKSLFLGLFVFTTAYGVGRSSPVANSFLDTNPAPSILGYVFHSNYSFLYRLELSRSTQKSTSSLSCSDYLSCDPDILEQIDAEIALEDFILHPVKSGIDELNFRLGINNI